VRRQKSIRWRITAIASVAITVFLLVGASGLVVLLRRALEQDVAGTLDQQIHDLVESAGTSSLPPVLESVGPEIGQLQVVDADGTVIATSRGIAQGARLDLIDAPAPGELATASVSGGLVDDDASERYRVVARTVATADGPITVYGVSSLRAADNGVRTMAIALFAGVPLLAGVAAVLLWRGVGGALAPVDAMRAEVDEIEVSSPKRRVTVVETDAEMARLGATLNHLLDRLDADVRRRSEFAAAASHELKSPLAAARTQLEVGLAYPERTRWEETASDVLVEIDRLERLSRELLDYARMGASEQGVTLAPVNLVEVVRAALPSGCERIAVMMEAPPGPVVEEADSDLLTRLVRNLLANALRHARSTIEVRLIEADDHVEV